MSGPRVVKARWGLSIVLLLLALYRSFVIRPLSIDVYLLYLPEVLFLGLYIILVFLCMTGGSRRQRACILVLGTLLVFTVLVPFRWEFPGAKSADLRLVSANLQSWENEDFETAVQTFKALKPDLLCLQEVWMEGDLEKIRLGFPEFTFWGDEHRLDNKGSFEYGTIVGVRKDLKPRPAFSTPRVVGALIEIREVDLLVLSCHGEKWHGAKSLEFSSRSILETSRLQASQAQRVLSLIRSHEGEVIVGGDFNASDSGPGLKILSAQLHSAFLQAGRGFGFTFPRSLPMTRIDHVLGSDGIEYSGYRTFELGSDHLGQVVDLEVSPN